MSLIAYANGSNPWQIMQINEESPLMVLGIDISEMLSTK